MNDPFDFERIERETHPSISTLYALAYRIDNLLTENDRWKLFSQGELADIQTAILGLTEQIRTETASLEGQFTLIGLITLAEAERRWGKTNLRQNKSDSPRRWKMGRAWMTTIDEMARVYGPEPISED